MIVAPIIVKIPITYNIVYYLVHIYIPTKEKEDVLNYPSAFAKMCLPTYIVAASTSLRKPTGR
jgi:hypothetical protein